MHAPARRPAPPATTLPRLYPQQVIAVLKPVSDGLFFPEIEKQLGQRGPLLRLLHAMKEVGMVEYNPNWNTLDNLKIKLVPK